MEVAERINAINSQLKEFNERLERSETVYNDETRMRKIVQDIVMPVVLVAKENALTNCYKNDEWKAARDEMSILQDRIESFRSQLEVLQEYDKRMIKTEERINNEISKANKNFEPTRKVAAQCKDEVTEIKQKVKEIRQTLQQREQRLMDLETLFIEHQKDTREDVMKRVQQNIDVIEQMHPKIQHITNLCTECTQFFNTTKDEFTTIH